MAEIVWSPRAIQDIQEIAEFIAKDSLQYAKAQTKLFIQEAGGLTNHPFRGRIVPELGVNSIRQLLCGHYRIIYEITGNEIAILTVHHQSRMLKNNPFIKRHNRKKL